MIAFSSDLNKLNKTFPLIDVRFISHFQSDDMLICRNQCDKYNELFSLKTL